jgi:hypothetical protein
MRKDYGDGRRGQASPYWALIMAKHRNVSLESDTALNVDPYPWAIEEGFDAYRTIQETKGRCIGMKSGRLGVVLTGDSA